MASNAVKAPRGSPFLNENGNLAPAWHHYLANIEKLTTGIVATDSGALLADIAARLDQLEALLDDAEAVYKERNWAFFYEPSAVLITEDTGNPAILAAHGLSTKHICARFEYTSDKHYSFQNNTRIYDEQSVGAAIGGTSGDLQAWVLGFYGYSD